MTAANASIETVSLGSRAEGIRDSTRVKAREVLALVDGQGWSVAAVSERSGFTEARVRQLLIIARAERPTDQGPESAADATAAPRKKISRRTMLDRAWVTMHIDRRLWTMDRGVRSFWLDVLMTLHQLGGPDGLRMGRYGDGFENRAEFASAHGGTEADLEALFRRSLLVSLANGGIAIPSDLGLRPWGKPPVASGALPTASHRSQTRQAGNGSVPGQRAFVMGMPASNSGTTTDTPDANSGASGEAGNANIFVSDDDADANICAGGEQATANFAANPDKIFLAGATTTTTEESESLGGGTGYRATAGNLAASENLRPDENFRANPALSSAEAPAWVTLGTELLETVGMRRPLAISEADLVRGWLEKGATPDILRGVFHTVLGRENCPANPALSYFDGAVLDMLGAGKRTPVAASSPHSTPAAGVEAPTQEAREGSEGPDAPVEWESDVPDKAALIAAWAKIRARLRDEVGDAEYRNWLRPMTLRGIDGDEVLVSLPGSFVRDWVRDHHGARVTALWQAEYPSVRRMEFRVSDAGRGPAHDAPRDSEASSGPAEPPEPDAPVPSTPATQPLADRPLNDRLKVVFENSRDRDVPGADQSPSLDAFTRACGDPGAERAANEWLDRMEAWHRAAPDPATCPAPFPTWMEERTRPRLV